MYKTPIEKVKVDRLLRREGRIVLRVSMWHERQEVMTLSVQAFYARAIRTRPGASEALLLARERYPFVKDGLTKSELAHTVKNLALMVAMQLGEPDAHIVSDDPTVKREALISVSPKGARDLTFKEKQSADKAT